MRRPFAFRAAQFSACIVLMWAAFLGAAPSDRDPLAAGFPLVINAGHSGDNTADLLARLERDVFTRRPDLVVLLVGTNDLLNSRHALPLEKYRENLHALVQRIRAARSAVILLTLPPVHAPYLLQRHAPEFYGPGGPRQRIAAGNEVIREVAYENQVLVADLFEVIAAAGGASDQPTSLMRNRANSGQEDGVHPTADGYRVIGRFVAGVVRGNLPRACRIVCFGDSITEGVHVAGQGTATGETYPAFLAEAFAQDPGRVAASSLTQHAVRSTSEKCNYSVGFAYSLRLLGRRAGIGCRR